MSGVNLKVSDTTLRKAMNTIEEGKYRIPEFQREFVWDRTDVVDLFDSIYNSYPIGSFFFWRVPREKSDFFRDVAELQQPSIEEVEESGFPEVNFVLDGQQRLTSLYVTLKGMEFEGTDYSKIVFDLDTEEFKIAEGKGDHLVRLSDVWQDRREIRDELSEERNSAFINCHDLLKEYEIPTIVVQSKDIDSVIDIFERINQKGTRLSRFDIVNANIWDEEFNLRNRIDEDIIESLQEIGFGDIDRGTVTQALALNIEDTCSTDAQKNLDADDVKREWEATKDGVLGAINYLKNKHGVARSEFIPYESLIPVLSYYLYQIDRNSVKREHMELIDKWFWRSSLSGRYSKATQGRMTEDAKKMKKIANDNLDVDFDFPPQISKESLIQGNIKRSTSGVRNAFLCLLARNNPRHFENGTEIDLTESQYVDFRINKHHIFPNAYLRDQGYNKRARKSIMDITFIPAELNKIIQDTSPKDYFSGIRDNDDFEEIMESHLIPYDEDSGIWDNDYDKFREQRAELVFSRLKQLMGDYSGLEADVKNDPGEAVSEIETRVRDFVHQQLVEAEGENRYWGTIPNDVNANVQRRISSQQEEHPELDVDSDRERLNYCDVTDYAKIINNRWDVFEDHFPSREAVNDRFLDFSDYRNAVAHNREADHFTKLDGEVAIEWIDSCIREES